MDDFFGFGTSVHNVSAVSGALLTPGPVYQELGGLDPALRELALVEYCVRATDRRPPHRHRPGCATAPQRRRPTRQRPVRAADVARALVAPPRGRSVLQRRLPPRPRRLQPRAG